MYKCRLDINHQWPVLTVEFFSYFDVNARHVHVFVPLKIHLTQSTARHHESTGKRRHSGRAGRWILIRLSCTVLSVLLCGQMISVQYWIHWGGDNFTPLKWMLGVYNNIREFCELSICNSTWFTEPDQFWIRICNTIIRQRTRVTDIVQDITNTKWKWAGHIVWMKYNRICRWTMRSTEWQIKGVR